MIPGLENENLQCGPKIRNSKSSWWKVYVFKRVLDFLMIPRLENESLRCGPENKRCWRRKFARRLSFSALFSSSSESEGEKRASIFLHDWVVLIVCWDWLKFIEFELMWVVVRLILVDDGLWFFFGDVAWCLLILIDVTWFLLMVVYFGWFKFCFVDVVLFVLSLLDCHWFWLILTYLILVNFNKCLLLFVEFTWFLLILDNFN